MADASWFSGRLRELREQAGLSRKDLADRADLSEGGIRDLEQDHRRPSWETVLALCAALGVDCTAFAQEPAEQPAPKKGRPRKTDAATTEVVRESREQPKKPRGKKPQG